MAKLHRFQEDEIDRYFSRICLPASKRVFDVSQLTDNEKLDFLNLLQKHHLVKVPWENTVQHYSWHRTVHLDPKHLFRKIVQNAGRGGYCMENNFFYHLILYSLGFQVHLAGSRIHRTEGNYGGWTHVVNLVTINGKKYLLDSGFGGQGPSRPVPLEHGVELTQIEPAHMRLMHEALPHNLDQSQKVWVYQHRYDENHPWVPMYCFVDFEFTPPDVENMNFAPSLSRQTFFTHKVVSVRFTTDKEVETPDGPESPNEQALQGNIDGSITINHDTLKWRKNGKKIVVIPFTKDADRVEALRKYFGIELSSDEQQAIINTAAMIGVKAMGVDD